jgi:hypothetical protein
VVCSAKIKLEASGHFWANGKEKEEAQRANHQGLFSSFPGRCKLPELGYKSAFVSVAGW